MTFTLRNYKRFLSDRRRRSKEREAAAHATDHVSRSRGRLAAIGHALGEALATGGVQAPPEARLDERSHCAVSSVTPEASVEPLCNGRGTASSLALRTLPPPAFMGPVP